MMPLVFQKQLAWLARFYNHVAAQQPLFSGAAQVVPTISVAHDWPLECTLLQPANIVSIAGSVPQIIYEPLPGFHGLVYSMTGYNAGATAFAGTDVIYVSLQPTEPAGATGTRIWRMEGIALAVNANFTPINTGFVGTTGTTNLFCAGPQYVRNGQRLRLDWESVAGGDTLLTRAWVLERPDYYPLRLP